MKKLRLCIVTDFFVPHYRGGGEKRYYEVLKRLAAKGHTIDLLCMGIEGVEKYEYIDGINVYHLGPRIKTPPKRSLLDFARFSSAAYSWLLRHNYDIIEANPWISMIPVSFAARLKRTRSTTVIHDLSSGKSDQWIGFSRYAGFFEKILVRLRFDGIICVSNNVRERLVKEYALKKEKISVFYDGVDIKFIDSVPAPKKAKGTICFVGRLIPHKHVDDLIDALRLVKRDIPSIKLKVIGGGQELASLREKAAKLNLGKNISFLGVIPDKDLIKEVKGSQLLVLPSTREGFGIVLVEAFACRIPCIAYRSDGVVEVIDDSENGYLIGQRDVKTLASKIRLLLKDRKKLAAFASSGREKTERLFDWDIISGQLENYYIALLGPDKK